MPETSIFSDSSKFVYTRTYAKWVEEKKRREIWEETVNRYVDFIVEERGNLIPPKVIKKIREKITNFEVMPSMRALWSAGKAAKNSNVCMYNCAALVIDSVDAFAETLYLLCCGTGVGFSVQKEYVNKLPVVSELSFISNGLYEIPDSKEGWADSIRILMNSLYNGKEIELDYSLIRPAGERLKTMGGRASGPEPLMLLHRFIRDIFFNAQKRKLTSLECHDILNQIAEIVVVGGVRRSSQISLSDLDDQELANAKKWPFPLRRTMSNNSAVYKEKPTAIEFIKEWSEIASSGTGERGIFNLYAAKKNAPERRNKDKIVITNPCGEVSLRDQQCCVSKDTPLITKNGIILIGDNRNKKVEVWNGQNWANVTIRRTGQNKKLLRVYFSDGSFLDTTPEHNFSVKDRFMKDWKKVQAKDLLDYKYTLQVENTTVSNLSEKILKDAYTIGFAVGDGCVYKGKVIIDLYGEKDFKCPVVGTRHKVTNLARYNVSSQRVISNINGSLISELKLLPLKMASLSIYSKKSILEFFAGWIDADGSETKTGGIRLYISDFERARMSQLLLTCCGIRSSVNLLQKVGTKTNLSTRKKDLWYLQITDCNQIPCYRVKTNGGHKPKYKAKYQNIVNVEELDGRHDVYCFNESLRHKAVFSNVLTYQCNLSEVVIKENDDLESLLDKVETATWIGVIQSTFTDFKFLRPKWKENCEEERLLGVSLTGQMDNKELLSDIALKTLKNKVLKIAKHASIKMGINMPSAVTTVKPSGTVSQLVNSASGIHPRYSKVYIRRYRISTHDPLFKMIKQQGIKVIPENGQENLPENKISTWIIEFPIKSPTNSIIRDNISALGQLDWYKHIAQNWCEHNPSCTVYVKNSEWLEVGNWIYKNWDIINGISFLPFDGGKYKLAPYEEITEEKYNQLIKEFKYIDYTKLSIFEKEDNTEGIKTFACSGDKCDIL